VNTSDNNKIKSRIEALSRGSFVQYGPRPARVPQRLGIEGEDLAQRAEFDATVVEATQQPLVAPRLGIVGDDLDDLEAVVDPKLLMFLIVVDGEQGMALIGAEDPLTGGRQGGRAGGSRRRMAIRSRSLNCNHRLGRCDQRGWHRSDQPGKQVATFIAWPLSR
jgi:hypothetical protein